MNDWYYKKPIATGSVKNIAFLMTLDKTFKGNYWVIIEQADRDTDWVESKAFFDCI